MTNPTPVRNSAELTLQSAKQQAKTLKQDHAAQGEYISHSQALEAVAKRNGYRSWPAMRARIVDHAPHGWSQGSTVTGHYLGHHFSGTLTRITQSSPGWYGVSIALDHPIDTVSHDSFSNLRSRLRAIIGDKGFTKETTSNGAPILALNLD